PTPPTTTLYTLSLHDALPIYDGLWTQQLYGKAQRLLGPVHGAVGNVHALLQVESAWSESLRRETAELLAREAIVEDGLANWPAVDRKSTRLNSSHLVISYAVF